MRRTFFRSSPFACLFLTMLQGQLLWLLEEAPLNFSPQLLVYFLLRATSVLVGFKYVKKKIKYPQRSQLVLKQLNIRMLQSLDAITDRSKNLELHFLTSTGYVEMGITQLRCNSKFFLPKT